MGMISLCSGVGGLDRAAVAAFGVPVIAHAEPPGAAVLAVLARRFPGVPNIGSIVGADWLLWNEPRPFALIAGIPCQPASEAGPGLGDADPRWLWPAMREGIGWTGPEWVVLENVRKLVTFDKGRLWRGILDDLREMHYDVAWGLFGACLVGAPHHRHRVFLVARRSQVYVTNGSIRSWQPAPARRWPGRVCDGRTGLLPTPRAVDGERGPVKPSRTLASGRRNGLELASALVAGAAVPAGAPDPLVPGERGGQSLNPRFAEWMMGFAPGYVTDVLTDRKESLRAIGNAVHPQQGYYAIRELLALLST